RGPGPGVGPAGPPGQRGQPEWPGHERGQLMNYRLTFAAAAGTLLDSTALYALFVGLEWFWAGAGAVIVVAAVGLATRIRRLPVLVCVAAGLAGLLLYLNLVFAPGQSWFAIIPHGSSLAH